MPVFAVTYAGEDHKRWTYGRFRTFFVSCCLFFFVTIISEISFQRNYGRKEEEKKNELATLKLFTKLKEFHSDLFAIIIWCVCVCVFSFWKEVNWSVIDHTAWNFQRKMNETKKHYVKWLRITHVDSFFPTNKKIISKCS